MTTLVDSGQCELFIGALRKANLTELLSADGQFTVLAPTDEAFRNLPPAQLEQFLKAENAEQLTRLLKGHILKGSQKTAALRSRSAADTLAGSRVGLVSVGAMLIVDTATVQTSDLECSNGLVQIVDAVLLPAESDITVTLNAAGFKTMAMLVSKSDVKDLIQRDWMFTVFAPTEEAFAKLPSGTVDRWLAGEKPAELSTFVKRHLCVGRVFTAGLDPTKGLKAADGQKLAIKRTGTTTSVEKASIVKPDVAASNGVIHGIDAILMQPGS